jgi:starvation-inducible outer membrane lipoprotein
MKPMMSGLIFWTALIVSGCGSEKVFPPEAVEGVDPNFDFARWRMMPQQSLGKKVRLGGRVVQGESKGGIVTVVIAHMSIVEHPAYGPKDTGKSKGEFAITYRGAIESAFLQPGNRVMVIGTTHGPTVINVDDVLKSLPTIVADCLHFWNTGGRDISDFPSMGGGYEPLEQRTACVSTS